MQLIKSVTALLAISIVIAACENATGLAEKTKQLVLATQRQAVEMTVAAKDAGKERIGSTNDYLMRSIFYPLDFTLNHFSKLY
jgi:hypothetical protein